MDKKEDKRITRTKHELLEAFFKMAEEMSFEDITVNELCQRAGIKRATFYKHFNDKYNFITYVTKSLRAEFDAQMLESGMPDDSVEYFFEYARAVILFLEEKEIAIKRMLESDMASTLINIIVEQNYIDTEKRLDKSAHGALSLPAQADTVAVMITGGITHIILRWLSEGKKKSSEELTGEIKLILNRFFR